MSHNTDTIYALSTPPGRGALAVVRVSGPQTIVGIKQLAGKTFARPRRMTLSKLIVPGSGEIIDKGLLVYFEGPNSYTGEDMCEYHIHGGPAVVSAMLEALSCLPGYRMAEPGEFTRRAFEHGKIDLTEAEAVADLIDAETQAQRQQSLTQLGGYLSRIYESWRERLVSMLAYIEVDLDFSDEDLPAGINQENRKNIEGLIEEISEHLNDNRRGERLRDGILIAVIGAPNAGKSSLVNAIARREAAIVSEYAGTTRDIIEVHLDLGGYPVILADTAGLRPDQVDGEGQESIEREGILRALKKANEADIKLLLLDGSRMPEMDQHTLDLRDENSITVINKNDLMRGELHGELKNSALIISAKAEEGLQELISHLTEKVEEMLGVKETPSLTRVRHRDALEECRGALERSLKAEMPELVAEDLRLAIRGLGRITGRVDVEDLLDIIFRDFCIGK